MPRPKPSSRFSDAKNRSKENRSKEALAPYEEFSEGGRTYYLTPGGFLYRKGPGTEEIGGFFCGFLPDETWHYRMDDS